MCNTVLMPACVLFSGLFKFFSFLNIVFVLHILFSLFTHAVGTFQMGKKRLCPAGRTSQRLTDCKTIDFLTGKLVLNLTPWNPYLCGILVQKCHFGDWGLNVSRFGVGFQEEKRSIWGRFWVCRGRNVRCVWKSSSLVNWSPVDHLLAQILVAFCPKNIILGFWVWTCGLRLTGKEKVDLWSLFTRTGMKRWVCLKVVFLHSFRALPQKSSRDP